MNARAMLSHVLLALAIMGLAFCAFHYAAGVPGKIAAFAGAGWGSAYYLGRELAQSFRPSDPTRLNIGPSFFFEGVVPALVCHGVALALLFA